MVAKISILLLIICTAYANYYPTQIEKIKSLKEYYNRGVLEDNLTKVNFDDPDCYRSALELINTKGYYGEAHSVTTYDKYILGIQRIPAPQNVKPDGRQRPAVLLWHGVGGCAVNWITNEANNSLGFMLANAGYDVWLGNSRGNTYSTNHERWNPTNGHFWKFSWDHMAAYDLPATIDYILNVTGNSYLYYGGHSQGTLIGFAQFSSDPSYAEEKVKAFFALAPVAHVGNIDGIEKAVAPYTEDIQLLAAAVGYNDFMPYNGYVHKLESKYCVEHSLKDEICDEISKAVVGNADKLNQSRIGVIMAHCPAGTSTQDMVHFGQMVNSDLMQAFDYDLTNDTMKRNCEKYGQETAPVYQVQDLPVPTLVFHSDSDTEADPTDVAWLISQISDVIVEDHHYTDYVHTDFIWALRAAEDVYPYIVSYIQQEEAKPKINEKNIQRKPKSYSNTIFKSKQDGGCSQ